MKIIVDSGCEVSDEVTARIGVGIEIAPLNLSIGDKHYIDDDSLDMEEYLNEMESSKETPKTASPSPSQFLERYERDGDDIYVVTLSSHLSGTNNSAALAKQMYLDRVPSLSSNERKRIHVFDSLSASVGETLIAMKIAEFYKNMFSDNEIIDNINKFIKNLKTYFILDKYDNLVKTGRMSPYIAKIASMLNIKPICGSDQGKIALVDKARGYNKAVKRLIEIISENKPDASGVKAAFEKRILGVSHVKCREKAVALRDEIFRHIPFKDSIILDMSGVCATYANRGGIVVAY